VVGGYSKRDSGRMAEFRRGLRAGYDTLLKGRLVRDPAGRRRKGGEKGRRMAQHVTHAKERRINTNGTAKGAGRWILY